MGDLIAMAFDLVGDKAKNADESRAKQAAESKARVEKAREQIREEVASGFGEKAAAEKPAAKPVETTVTPDVVPLLPPAATAKPAATADVHADLKATLADLSDADLDFTADDALHTIAMNDPEFRAPPEPAPVPVRSEALDAATLRGTHGMPEANQQKIQEVADRMGVVIDVRPTTAAAPELLEGGALPKFEDLKSKTIGAADKPLGATAQEGQVGFFKPQAEGDLSGSTAERWWQRDMEFWDNAKKMTELQKPVADQHGTKSGKQVVVGADGAVRAVDPATGGTKAITGDHDVFDIRKADGTPLTRAEYLEVLKALKAGSMGVEHGAHMRWAEDLLANEGRELTPAEKLIFEAILKRHASGKEPLIRFAPGKAPQTAAPR